MCNVSSLQASWGVYRLLESPLRKLVSFKRGEAVIKQKKKEEEEIAVSGTFCKAPLSHSVWLETDKRVQKIKSGGKRLITGICGALAVQRRKHSRTVAFYWQHKRRKHFISSPFYLTFYITPPPVFNFWSKPPNLKRPLIIEGDIKVLYHISSIICNGPNIPFPLADLSPLFSAVLSPNVLLTLFKWYIRRFRAPEWFFGTFCLRGVNTAAFSSGWKLPINSGDVSFYCLALLFFGEVILHNGQKNCFYFLILLLSPAKQIFSYEAPA